MTDHAFLRSAALIQLAHSQPKIRALLERIEGRSGAGGATDLPSYAELAPGVPGMEVFGGLGDAVERLSYDVQAQNDPIYGVVMYTAVLTEIVAAQQDALVELREALEEAKLGAKA